MINASASSISRLTEGGRPGVMWGGDTWGGDEGTPVPGDTAGTKKRETATLKTAKSLCSVLFTYLQKSKIHRIKALVI